MTRAPDFNRPYHGDEDELKRMTSKEKSDEEVELYECPTCGDMTPDLGICFMCKETMI